MSDSQSSTLVDALRQCLGPIKCPGDANDFAAALYQRPESILRYRREIWDPLETRGAAVPYYGLAYGFDETETRPSKRLAYCAGDYFIQDPGSLLALAAAGADNDQLKGKLVLDLCASPGGKSTALLEAVGEDGFVLANEVIHSRLAALSFNLTRTGSPRYAISQLDPDKLADRLGGIFDVVLVDAPCSGQALLGRGKQSDGALDTKAIAHSAARQNRILDSAVRLTRPGGTLVYSTCTFAFDENEFQMQRLVDGGVVAPDPQSRLAEYQTDSGCYRTWPHRDLGSGSFAARMTVQENIDPAASETLNSHGESLGGNRSKRASKLRSKFPESFPQVDWSVWHDAPPEGTRWILRKAHWIGFPPDCPDWAVKIAVDGPQWTYQTGKTWRPSHSTARRQKPFSIGAASVELDDEQAISFVAGHPVAFNGGDRCDRGWHIATWRGRPLGWLKSDGKRGNNYLPSAARESVSIG